MNNNENSDMVPVYPVVIEEVSIGKIGNEYYVTLSTQDIYSGASINLSIGALDLLTYIDELEDTADDILEGRFGNDDQ